MEIRQIKSRQDRDFFYSLPERIYQNNNCYRTTENDLVKLLIEGHSFFHTHAKVLPFIVIYQDSVLARFALIQDEKLAEYVQVSFFEAYPQIEGLLDIILSQIKESFPIKKKYIIGLNGHLNYGAGFLLNKFDEPPLFGLSYSPLYYQDYFTSLIKHEMVSFKFSMEGSHDYVTKAKERHDIKNFHVRPFNKKKLIEEVKIYTYLNNVCFHDHPFWTERHWKEDYELFFAFRFLIKEENMLFIEFNNKPIGFLLWYPDFNKLVSSKRSFNIFDILRYKIMNPIRTLRFTEIGVLPEYRKSPAVLALIYKLTLSYLKHDYDFCEGGFIFQQNKNSIQMTIRYLERSFGKKLHLIDVMLFMKDILAYENRIIIIH